MAKVTIMMKNGLVKTIDRHLARALVHCKKAVYAEDYQKKVIKPDAYEIKTVDRIEDKTQDDDELTALRKEYTEKFGKKYYHGWTIEELKSKIESE